MSSYANQKESCRSSGKERDREKLRKPTMRREGHSSLLVQVSNLEDLQVGEPTLVQVHQVPSRPF